jgi:hypothetical protein
MVIFRARPPESISNVIFNTVPRPTTITNLKAFLNNFLPDNWEALGRPFPYHPSLPDFTCMDYVVCNKLHVPPPQDSISDL